MFILTIQALEILHAHTTAYGTRTRTGERTGERSEREGGDATLHAAVRIRGPRGREVSGGGIRKVTGHA